MIRNLTANAHARTHVEYNNKLFQLLGLSNAAQYCANAHTHSHRRINVYFVYRKQPLNNKWIILALRKRDF